MEYLVFGVTRDGVKLINRKIESITNMKPPTSQKEVRKFIGLINNYRGMWSSWSHMLLPLTILTYIKRKFNWTLVKQDYFNEIKRIVARDTLSTYPDLNEIFKIHTDASAFQLGGVASHKDKLIAFYYRKLTGAQ